MLYIFSILLALVQALTEFLPISSSAHLIIFHQIIKEPILDNAAFDVMLHAGTFLAVLICFWQEVKQIVIAVFSKSLSEEIRLNKKLGWLLVWSALPAAMIGYFFNEYIELTFRSVYWLIWPLVIGGLLLLAADKWGSKLNKISSLGLGKVLLIGCAQVLAFIPGTSRSGITITAGLSLGLTKMAAARFSFLMSLPIVLGATIKKISSLGEAGWAGDYFWAALVGAIASAVLGIIVIKFFMRFLSNHSLTIFAVYRFVIALVLAIIFF